jgi:hypothetical protein
MLISSKGVAWVGKRGKGEEGCGGREASMIEEDRVGTFYDGTVRMAF